MIIYILILFILAYPFINKGSKATNSDNSIKWYFIILFLLSALNYGLGFDTFGWDGHEGGYVEAYKNINPLGKLSSNDFMNEKWQPGFVILFSCFKSISSNYLVYQIFHAFLINAIIFLFLRKTSYHVALCLFFYCILSYFDYNFEIQRESFCIVLGLLIYLLLDKNAGLRNTIIAIGLAIAAFLLLHRSAFILILYPLLKHIRLNGKVIWVTCIISILIQYLWVTFFNSFFMIINIISGDVYEGYISQDFLGGTNYKYFIFKVFTNVLIPYFCVYCSYKSGNNKYLVYVIISILFERLSEYTYAFHRLYGYFAPFYWIVLTDTLVYIDKKYLHRSNILRFITILLVTAYIMGTYHYVYFLYDDRTNGYVYEQYFPYRSVLESGNSY